ncbi:MAG: ornithine cyclodeaminase family protein [Bacteroidetes bacterium]|nr:ornithine cyclodeaminase family protein [Bacteroidota bacterium]
MPLILNRKDVQSVLTMKDCIQAVENAFAELSNGTAILPLRNNITSPEGLSLYMPAFLKDMGALACKVVTVFKNNPSKNLPVIFGKVLLQDTETGDVLCIMDGAYLTAVRTGAASGVANKYLAKKDKNQVIGIYGTGVQAKMQLWAMKETVDIAKVLVYDINENAVDNFIIEMKKKFYMEIIKATDPNELLASDIICTATSSPTPLFDGNKLKPGTHINNIGSHTPNARELDTFTVKNSKLVGDSKEACFSEAGDIMIPLKEEAITVDHFYAELGDLVTSKKKGRTNDNEITVFKSNGLAIQDAAAAKLIYDKAMAAGIGVNVDI